ncbi:hypothetical protein BCR36DRAFT_414274 [Piromyces finnis]|uniref:SH3 domain-containing protein n=1 Tax=Piromyces finnis TaxID=1754191 RepID=A0A1Y1V2W1_9FUNG|nr:hypothetical protein BCR36DRAFT_414274 [Piromyces finnis]|eukprot:ORX45962.1 hypothetical protein BCR36DRAFT_414274 [Piromyces finnis]
MDGNKCFKLENSKYCSNFNGHYVIKRKGFNNTESFDQYLQKYFEFEDSYKKFLVDNFKCSNQNLPDFRYRRSFICNNYVVIPYISNNINLCESQISNDKNANIIPYCYTSCSAAVDSIEEIVKDKQYDCSQVEVQNRINGYKTSCKGNNSEVSECVLGMGDEIKYCGYSNNEDKKKYCQQNKAITDECCSDNYEADGYIFRKDKAGESSSKLTTVLFVLTLIASTIITVLLYIYRQKRSKKNIKYMRQLDDNQSENSTKLPYEDDEGNTSYTVKSSENNLFYVFHEYIPKINDEIQLNVSDIVRVKKIFDDGWAYGTNISTDCEGALPLACCIEYHSSISTMMMSYSAPPLGPVNHRESSLIT